LHLITSTRAQCICIQLGDVKNGLNKNQKNTLNLDFKKSILVGVIISLPNDNTLCMAGCKKGQVVKALEILDKLITLTE
jgi:hypothetical protein